VIKALGRILEAGVALRVVGEVFVEDLERHLAAEPRVGGAPNLAHAAGAEPGGDLEGAE
jgi:hypothetical protein